MARTDAIATAALTLRSRAVLGPATQRAAVPFGSLVLSVIAHASCFAVMLAGTVVFRPSAPKVYVVNLVPPAPQASFPAARPAAPAAAPTPAPVPKQEPRARPAPEPPRAAPPPRPAELPGKAAPAEPSKPIDLPGKPALADAARPGPALPDGARPGPRETPSLPAPNPSTAKASGPPDLPRSSAPALPEATPRASSSLPLPGDPALPKTGDKPLPPLPSTVASRPAPTIPPPSATPPQPTPSTTPATPSPSPAAAVPSPPAPGPLLGTPKVTALSDFPFRWYLEVVQRRVAENWKPLAGGGNRPLIVFEIDPRGRVTRIVTERSSGNAVFDRSAEGAIRAATPFPPLPQEFKEPLLRVHLEFERT